MTFLIGLAILNTAAIILIARWIAKRLDDGE